MECDEDEDEAEPPGEFIWDEDADVPQSFVWDEHEGLSTANGSPSN